MKITKSGAINYPWTGEWKCNKCGCTWELDEKDKPTFVPDNRDGDFYQMPCPECGVNSTRYAKKSARQIV